MVGKGSDKRKKRDGKEIEEKNRGGVDGRRRKKGRKREGRRYEEFEGQRERD